MNKMEKLAYLKGLVSGLALDENKKDTKVIHNLIELLEDVVYSVTSMEECVNELQLQVDAIDEDLGEVEKDLYEDADECCCGKPAAADPAPAASADELYYEVTCPTCGDTICLDDDLISVGEIDCPNCGEKLEFDLEG